MTLTAVPDAGHAFAGWGGSCSGTGACTVTADAERLVVATFSAPTTAVEYYHTDALGSVRAVTKVVNGQVQVVSRHDFMPFGEEVNPPNPPTERRLFTGQERDFETGLDYFNARQLATGLGRFTAPDPLSVLPYALGDPQTHTRYAYARHNPLRFVDPMGLEPWEGAVTLGMRLYDYFNPTLRLTGPNILMPNGLIVSGEEMEEGRTTLTSIAENVSAASGLVATPEFIGFWYGASFIGGLGVGTAVHATGASLTALGIGSAPLLPAVPSALLKLQSMGLSPGQATQIVTSLNKIEVLDMLHQGNINVFQQIGDRLVRITLDPSGKRIISAGYVQVRNVTNSIASGRFIPR